MTILSPSQKAVVDHFPHFLLDEDANEMTIAGFAGSGKTFLISHLVGINDKIQAFVRTVDSSIPRRRLYFTATTNKAAAVLEDMLGVEARTIHSLLGLRVFTDYKTGKEKLGQRDKRRHADLNYSIIFIDEASMINRELLQAIRKIQKEWKSCKVVFIGDEYQLPPVKEDVCPVFDDKKHTVRLTEIQRQVADNPIIQLSAEYRACLDDHTRPWPEIPTDDKRICHYTDKHEFFKIIKSHYTQPHHHDDLKIIAWSNPRVLEYNAWIRRLHGLGPTLHVGETVVTNRPLLDADRMILAKTDSRHTIKEIIAAEEQGVRGHRVFLHDISQAFFQPWDWREARELAKFLKKDAKQTSNWEPYFWVTKHWADLRPIHASTVHKAQGSTYRQVFVDLNNIGKNNNWREVARLTYVAITRASERVHIYGSLQERYNRRPVIDLLEPFKNVDCLTH